jgi:hypothetical protein
MLRILSCTFASSTFERLVNCPRPIIGAPPFFLNFLLASVSALPEIPPEPIGPILTETLSSLLPDELSLETFNAQYLQRHPTDPKAVIAAAKVSRTLDAPLEEVEAAVFNVLNPEVRLDVKVTLNAFFFFFFFFFSCVFVRP